MPIMRIWRQPNSALDSSLKASNHLDRAVGDAERYGDDDRRDGDDHEHFDEGESRSWAREGADASLHGLTIGGLLAPGQHAQWIDGARGFDCSERVKRIFTTEARSHGGVVLLRWRPPRGRVLR